MKKEIPTFNNEDEEIEFWDKNDSSDFVDWSNASEGYFPNLKPTLKTISLRLPESLINDLKILANKRDIPYQSLLKILLAEKVKELKSA